MRQKKDKSSNGVKQMQQFIQHLLADVQALEHMIQEDWFEKDIVRMGAEHTYCDGSNRKNEA